MAWFNTISNMKYLWVYFEGFWPEWCISKIYHAWDTPFWSGTLDLNSMHDKSKVKDAVCSLITSILKIQYYNKNNTPHDLQPLQQNYTLQILQQNTLQTHQRWFQMTDPPSWFKGSFDELFMIIHMKFSSPNSLRFSCIFSDQSPSFQSHNAWD